MPAIDWRRRKPVALASAWALAVLALLPVLFQWQPLPPLTGRAAHLLLDLAYLSALLMGVAMYRVERAGLSGRRAFILIFLIFLLTGLTNNVHRFYVDRSSVSANSSNAAWQIDLQDRVMRLSPSVAPHSYRFLPNSIVRWMQLARFSYESARDFYRLIFGLLLFHAI